MLNVGKLLVSLVGLLQAVVDVGFALFHHLGDNGKAKLGEHEEDDEKCQKHPEQESQVRSEYCWQIL